MMNATLTNNTTGFDWDRSSVGACVRCGDGHHLIDLMCSDCRQCMTVEDAVEILGADHVTWILRQPYAVGTCDSLAIGRWRTNEFTSERAYRILASHLAIPGAHMSPHAKGVA